MKPILLVVVVGTLLAGCAGTMEWYGRPLEQRYTRLQWATLSVHEADAQCLMEVQRTPYLGFPVCMRAKGWEERR